MLELIRRCKYCSREMMNVSPLSWRENPFCQECLHERMQKASEEAGPMRWERISGTKYIRFIRLNEDGSDRND